MAGYVGMSSARIIYEKLKERGVALVCGIPGGASFDLFDCFHPENNIHQNAIRLVQSSHEQSAGHTAEGYAKVTGQPGVVLVTTGPGVTNLITPLYDALQDGVPLLAICAQVDRTAPPNTFQRTSTIELTRVCTKWNYALTCASEVPWVMDYAFELAMRGQPGPVLLDCPSDVQREILTEQRLAEYTALGVDGHQLETIPSWNYGMEPLDSEEMRLIADLVNNAEKPILVIGQGCQDASVEVEELVVKANIPVTTTMMAKGVFDERHALSLGMHGMYGLAAANLGIQEADLIIAVGSCLAHRCTGKLSRFAPEARKAQATRRGGIIHVDIRKTEKSKMVEPIHFVNSDAKLFLKALIPRTLSRRDSDSWLQRLQSLQNMHPLTVPHLSDDTLSPQSVLRSLDAIVADFRDECIFTTGAGFHQVMAAQFLTLTRPRCFLTSGMHGTMGSCLGFSIGAQLARPEETVIAVDGDGSFNMTSSELKTVAELQLPIKIILMNNHSYGIVSYFQTYMRQGRTIACDQVNPDYNKLADAYGIANFYCSTMGELDRKMKEFLHHTGPALLNANVVNTPCLPFVPFGQPLDKMLFHDPLADK